MKAKERPRVWVEQFQRKLYLASKASETRRFGVLYDKVYRIEVLQQAWKRVKRNRGSAGIDGKSIKKIVRYADDMVLFCRTEKQAHYVLKKLRGQFEKLGLTLNEEKTKIVHVREGFDFLGYTIKEAYSYNSGKLVRIKFPRPKSEKNMRQKIKDAIKSMTLGTDLLEIITMLNRKLSGWANYFKIGNSYKQALRLADYVCEQLRLYWRRCKHRKDIRGSVKWRNSYFYDKGLHYVPNLLSR